MKSIFVFFVVLSAVISEPLFSDEQPDENYPGISTAISRFENLWPGLRRVEVPQGLILLSESIASSTVPKENRVLLSGRGTQRKQYFQFGSEVYFRTYSGNSPNTIFSEAVFYGNPLVFCLPGNDSLYVVYGIPIGCFVEKYKVESDKITMVDQPIKLLVIAESIALPSQKVYLNKDTSSPVVGIITAGSSVDVIGISEDSTSNNFFSCWLLIKLSSGISGWINYTTVLESRNQTAG